MIIGTFSLFLCLGGPLGLYSGHIAPFSGYIRAILGGIRAKLGCIRAILSYMGIWIIFGYLHPQGCL